MDDNEGVRTSFVAVLRVAGYEVIEAPDGFVALEMLDTHDVVAVALDARMPVLDGLAVLDRLDNPPPILLVSADNYDIETMRRRGKIFAFIQKPVPPDALIALVADAIRSRIAE